MQAWRRRRGIFKEVWCALRMEAPDAIPCSHNVHSPDRTRSPAPVLQLTCVILSVAARMQGPAQRKHQPQESSLLRGGWDRGRCARIVAEGKLALVSRADALLQVLHEPIVRCRFRTSSAARRCGHAEPLDRGMATQTCRQHGQRHRSCAPSGMVCGPEGVAYACGTMMQLRTGNFALSGKCPFAEWGTA